MTKNNPYIISVINNISGAVLGVLTSTFLNRYLGVELKGDYAYYLNVANILIVVFGLGIINSYPMAKRKEIGNIKNKFFQLFVLIYAISTTALLTYWLIECNEMALCLFLYVPIQILCGQLGYMIAVEYLKGYQKMYFFGTILNLLLTICAFSFFNQDIVIAFVIIAMKDVIAIIYYIRKLKPSIKSPIFRIEEISLILKVSLTTMVSTLLLDLNYKADIIMLGNMVERYDVGLYATGVGLANYIWLIPDAFKIVLFSKTAKDNSVNDINWSIKVSLLISLVCIISLLSLGKQILYILYGEDFIPAYKVTSIIIFGAPSMILFKMTSSLFIANAQHTFYVKGLLVSAIANIGLNLMLIGMWGINGAAFASVCSYTICGFIFYRKYCMDYGVAWHAPLVFNKQDRMLIKDIIKNKLGHEG